MSDLHLLSLGAGVQSSTLALMAAHGVVTPMPSAAIFADTGNEPAGVYRWLDYLETQLPFPVFRAWKTVSKAPAHEKRLSADVLQLRSRRDGSGTYVRQPIPGFVLKNGKPSILSRGCTRDYKIRPIVRTARLLKRHAKATHVVQWYGISTDEADRMKDPPEHDFSGRWPLIELGMSRQDCLDWMEQHGFPRPPRSACSFCPFHSDAEWARLKREEPEAFAEAVQFEREMQALLTLQTNPTVKQGIVWLHDSCQPLDTVAFKDSTRDKFSNECSGSCGV